MENFKTLVDAYVAELATKHSEYCKATFPILHESYNGEYYKFSTSNGQKFIKVIVNQGGQNSVHCFIEKANGNLHKPATWKAPQKNGVRGNIANDVKPIFCGDFYANR